MMRTFFTRIKTGTEDLNYGREIIAAMVTLNVKKEMDEPLRILDVGLGTGADLLNMKNIFDSTPPDLHGIDSYQPNIMRAKANGITVHTVDIERDALPYNTGFFDLVIANQIIEHTKEIFWIFSEISRVLKKGGIVVVGVPNLGSLHNRILLLFGEQPSAIEMLGPHVRGITKRTFKKFITTDGYYEVLDVKGSNFYPFPEILSKSLSKLFPAMSVSLFFCCRRTSRDGVFGDVLKTRFFETNFFVGGGAR